MQKMMKPVKFGCDNGFQEFYFQIESPEKFEEGKVHCYLNRLSDENKKDSECLKKCASMKPNECWKA